MGMLKRSAAADVSGKSRLSEVQTSSGMFIHKNKKLKRYEIADNVSGKSQLSEVRTNSGMFIHKNKAKTELKRSEVADVSVKSQLSEVRKNSGMFIHKNKEMSARNKKNRAANELPPTVGSRSVARIIDMKQRKGEKVTEREGEEVTEREGEEVTGIDRFGTTEIDRFGIAHFSEKKKEMVSEKAKKIWSGMQNDAAASSATPAEICLKWLKRIPGHLKGRSAPKKEILSNERLRKQVEHERKRAEASEEKVEQLTEMCTTLVQENADIKRKMGYVLDQLAHLTGVQLPQEF